jgi:hypothetical protein
LVGRIVPLTLPRFLPLTQDFAEQKSVFGLVPEVADNKARGSSVNGNLRDERQGHPG